MLAPLCTTPHKQHEADEDKDPEHDRFNASNSPELLFPGGENRLAGPPAPPASLSLDARNSLEVTESTHMPAGRHNSLAAWMSSNYDCTPNPPEMRNRTDVDIRRTNLQSHPSPETCHVRTLTSGFAVLSPVLQAGSRHKQCPAPAPAPRPSSRRCGRPLRAPAKAPARSP